MPKIRKVTLPDSDIEIDGKVRLLLSGFGQQTIISVDDVVNAIKILPAKHLAGLKEISYDPNRLFQSLAYYLNILPNRRSRGEFVQNQRQINIYAFKTPERFHHILYHEIGHYVYFVIIDSETKKEWVTKIYPRGGFITHYAKRNAAEDFAECYSYYVYQPEKLMAVDLKYRFMRDRIFANNALKRPRASMDLAL